MVTRAKRESNNRWDRENMTILGCKVKREVADQAREAARLAGVSINALLRQTIDRLIAGDVQPDSSQAAAGGVVLDSPELVAAVQEAAAAAGMTPREWVEDVVQRELFG